MHKIKTYIIIIIALIFYTSGFSQTNVRGWYAKGQVWIIWKLTGTDSLTYAIYSKPTVFLSTNNATLTGRIFQHEWSGYELKHNASDTNAKQRVPLPNDTGHYTLLWNEGLFVETVTETSSKFYGVVKYADTLVNINNRVNVNYTYNINDPPICHVQYFNISPDGFKYTIYSMWTDGRDDQNGGRSDFPVMGNKHKNGVPHIFIVCEPLAGLPPGKIPAVAFFHGGGGSAKQSIPINREEINITPADGILIAHNDKFERVGDSTAINQNSWFFGYYKTYNPFIESTPLSTDTVINYTQRRIIWIHDWLVKYTNIDSNRVSIMGHSMGSSGATQLIKAYPNKFSSACIFNNGLDGPEAIYPIFGDKTTNSPTNLRNINGTVVHFGEIFNLTSNISPYRDLPLVRIFNGKNDQNGTMRWDSIVVKNYRETDSIGYGMHLYWDEREHGLEQWHGSHWSHSANSSDQTQRDDGLYQSRYRKDQSFPAFYNHEGRVGNYDPGNGTPSNGDPWGTWGGYHDWDTNIVDTEGRWEATCCLVGDYLNSIDSCPSMSLTSDVAIRKPQIFLPASGSTVYWRIVRVSTGDTIQSGNSVVDLNGLVKAPNINIYRYPDKVKIIFFNPAGITTLNLRVIPQGFYNPANNKLNMRDTVSIVLKDAITFATIDSARGILDSILLGNTFKFYNAPTSTYYIVVRHRNSIETWSRAGGELITAGSIFNYDFANLQNKAYGNNMIQVDTSPLRFAMYSGDVNQDGTIDLSDLSLIDNDSYNFVSGYASTDVTGDNTVDLSDAAIADNNAFNFVSVVRP